MTERVRWRPVAFADLFRVVANITAENPIAARRIGREILLAGDSLESFPYRGRLGRVPETRELVTVYPYIIVYEVDDSGRVHILRVWHGAQDRP